MSKLRNELINDPLGRGYSGMTDQEILNDLTTAYVTRDIERVTGDKVFQATDASEFSSLTADDKQLWMAFCGRSQIDPWAPANVAFVQSIFGSGSATVSSLSAVRTESINRLTDLGIAKPTLHQIGVARG